MNNKIKNSNFVIVTHKLYHGVADDLKKYLLDHKCKHLWFIGHEFSSSATRKSFMEYYVQGNKKAVYYSPDFRFLPEILIYLKDLFFTFFWLISCLKNSDYYFGLGGINVFCGFLLKKRLCIKKIIYYSIDYMPVRFSNPILNNIYHKLDLYCVNQSNQTWNLSPMMIKLRDKIHQGKIKKESVQKVVPVGVWCNEIRRNRFSDRHANELIFVGHLLKKQGVQIVLKAIPEIVKSHPTFKFRVIGGGEYESVLKKMTRDLKIEKNVIFEGHIFAISEIYERLAKAAIGIAMYEKNKDNFTYYADPTKIRNYLASSLPVIMTDVPYNARELEREKCAVIVAYDEKQVGKAVLDLLNDKGKLREYQKNAGRYAQKYDWKRILDDFFRNL